MDILWPVSKDIMFARWFPLPRRRQTGNNRSFVKNARAILLLLLVAPRRNFRNQLVYFFILICETNPFNVYLFIIANFKGRSHKPLFNCRFCMLRASIISIYFCSPYWDFRNRYLDSCSCHYYIWNSCHYAIIMKSGVPCKNTKAIFSLKTRLQTNLCSNL